jgi:hypothetical protein
MRKQPRHAQDGLRGDDKQQARLRDAGSGVRDPNHQGGKPHAGDERRTSHEDPQQGADVRPDSDVVPDVDLPEGLRRQPQGPYDRDRGRG